MSAELDRDLGAWARDELSRERLLAAHGSAAAAIVGVHDRLTTAAAAVSVRAAEPGWAALLAQIDAPAPVIPLHPRRVRRTVSIAVAAAIAFAGIAYAASSRRSNDGAPTVSPAPSAPAALGPITPGAGSNDRPSVHAPAPRAGSPSVGGPSGADSPSPHERGTSTRGVDGGGGGVEPGDDPHDRDQGTGNDGPHNDHGSGNNGPEGSRPPNSHGH